MKYIQNLAVVFHNEILISTVMFCLPLTRYERSAAVSAPVPSVGTSVV